MSEKMRQGHTYQRPPSKSHGTVNTGGSSAGKVTGNRKGGPTVVNNSTQGRGVPKRGR